MQITLDEIQLFQPPEAGFDPVLNLPIHSAHALWQGAPAPPAPQILSFEPLRGLPGTPVVIHGIFLGGTTAVLFGTAEAVFEIANDEILEVVVPTGAVDGPITVVTPGGTVTSSEIFTVAAPLVLEGPNQFLDPSFEESVSEWRAVEGSIDRSTESRTGNYSMRASRGPMVRRFDLSDRPNHVPSVGQAGDVYRFTAWVKEVSGGVSVRLKVKEYLEGTHLQTSTFAAQPLSRHWQRFAVEITSLSAGSSLDFQFVFEPTLPDAQVLVDDVSVRQQGSGPSLSAPTFVDALPGEPVEVVVTAADASGAPLVSLAADLFNLPMLSDATFAVDPDFSRGVLRWTPQPEDGAWEHAITFRGRSVVEGIATTGIRVAAPDPRRVLIDFEARDSRWRGHRGATVEWTATGRPGSPGALIVRGPNPMSTFGANDYPNWVPYTGTQVGARFRYSCWVRAVSGEGRGLLRINEYLLGVQVGGSTLSGKIPLTRDWQQIVVERLTEAAGSSLDVRIECEPTSPDAAFMVDDLTIRYPEGLVAAERFAASGTFVLERPTVFPNPVRDRATLSWSIAAAGPVRVGIYDVHGRRVRSVLHDPEAQPGTHHLMIDRNGDDGRQLLAGIYFCRIEAGDGERKARFVILE
jgi:hypothetical protein